jgi:4a-hydroxytetrahydrobiopterin dehydratase
MPAPLLSPDAIAEALESLDGWDGHAAALSKTFVFADFVTAFGWMTSVALVAERMNHHPDWSNVYKTVKVQLSTHDAGGVTQLDLELAAAMNLLAG